MPTIYFWSCSGLLYVAAGVLLLSPEGDFRQTVSTVAGILIALGVFMTWTPWASAAIRAKITKPPAFFTWIVVAAIALTVASPVVYMIGSKWQPSFGGVVAAFFGLFFLWLGHACLGRHKNVGKP
jgi:hypothetical protein